MAAGSGLAAGGAGAAACGGGRERELRARERRRAARLAGARGGGLVEEEHARAEARCCVRPVRGRERMRARRSSAAVAVADFCGRACEHEGAGRSCCGASGCGARPEQFEETQIGQLHILAHGRSAGHHAAQRAASAPIASIRAAAPAQLALLLSRQARRAGASRPPPSSPPPRAKPRASPPRVNHQAAVPRLRQASASCPARIRGCTRCSCPRSTPARCSPPRPRPRPPACSSPIPTNCLALPACAACFYSRSRRSPALLQHARPTRPHPPVSPPRAQHHQHPRKIASNRSKPGGTPGHPVETGAQTGAIRRNPGAPSGPGPGLDRARQSQIRFDRVLDRFDPFSSNFDFTFCPKF
nr:uncharacterized protein LOC127332479 [Lolium perenne]